MSEMSTVPSGVSWKIKRTLKNFDYNNIMEIELCCTFTASPSINLSKYYSNDVLPDDTRVLI